MPIAFIMLLLVCVMPISMTWVAKLGAFRLRDNANPREWRKSLSGYRERAYAAQDNTFEAIPFVACAIFVSYLLRGDHATLTNLSVLIFVCRLFYCLCYLFDKPTMRSLFWAGAYIGCVALFFV